MSTKKSLLVLIYALLIHLPIVLCTLSDVNVPLSTSDRNEDQKNKETNFLSCKSSLNSNEGSIYYSLENEEGSTGHLHKENEEIPVTNLQEEEIEIPITNLQDKNETLKEEKQLLAEENNGLNEKNNQLVKELNEIKQQQINMEKQSHVSSNNHNLIIRNIDETNLKLHDEITQLKIANENLKKEIGDFGDKQLAIEEKNETLRENNEILEMKNDDLNNENTDLKYKLFSVIGLLSEQKEEMQAQVELLQKLRNAVITNGEAKVVELGKIEANYRMEIDELQRENNLLIEKIKDLKQKQENMLIELQNDLSSQINSVREEESKKKIEEMKVLLEKIEALENANNFDEEKKKLNELVNVEEQKIMIEKELTTLTANYINLQKNYEQIETRNKLLEKELKEAKDMKQKQNQVIKDLVAINSVLKSDLANLKSDSSDLNQKENEIIEKQKNLTIALNFFEEEKKKFEARMTEQQAQLDSQLIKLQKDGERQIAERDRIKEIEENQNQKDDQLNSKEKELEKEVARLAEIEEYLKEAAKHPQSFRQSLSDEPKSNETNLTEEKNPMRIWFIVMIVLIPVIFIIAVAVIYFRSQRVTKQFGIK